MRAMEHPCRGSQHILLKLGTLSDILLDIMSEKNIVKGVEKKECVCVCVCGFYLDPFLHIWYIQYSYQSQCKFNRSNRHLFVGSFTMFTVYMIYIYVSNMFPCHPYPNVNVPMFKKGGKTYGPICPRPCVKSAWS